MLQVNSLAYSYAPYLGELNFKLLYFIRRKLCFSHFMFWNLKKKKLYIFVVYLCDIITREKETKLQKKNKNEIDESGNTTMLHLNANFEHLFEKFGHWVFILIYYYSYHLSQCFHYHLLLEFKVNIEVNLRSGRTPPTTTKFIWRNAKHDSIRVYRNSAKTNKIMYGNELLNGNRFLQLFNIFKMPHWKS